MAVPADRSTDSVRSGIRSLMTILIILQSMHYIMRETNSLDMFFKNTFLRLGVSETTVVWIANRAHCNSLSGD